MWGYNYRYATLLKTLNDKISVMFLVEIVYEQATSVCLPWQQLKKGARLREVHGLGGLSVVVL